jgi:hypothetical protein
VTAQIAAKPDAEFGSALISPQRRNFVFLAIMLGMLMAALNRITHRIVARPDWDEERPRSITAAGQAPGLSV